MTTESPSSIRQRWMRLMGLDEQEIQEKSESCSLYEEMLQLEAAKRLCETNIYRTRGPIFINEGNIQVALPTELASFYYSLIPKYLGVKRIGRPAHLTAVRQWEAQLPEWIGKLVGQMVDIRYFPPIKQHGPHFVIEADSEQLIDLRLKLGLLAYRQPWNCFHFTVGYVNE